MLYQSLTKRGISNLLLLLPLLLGGCNSGHISNVESVPIANEVNADTSFTTMFSLQGIPQQFKPITKLEYSNVIADSIILSKICDVKNSCLYGDNYMKIHYEYTDKLYYSDSYDILLVKVHEPPMKYETVALLYYKFENKVVDKLRLAGTDYNSFIIESSVDSSFTFTVKSLFDTRNFVEPISYDNRQLSHVYEKEDKYNIEDGGKFVMTKNGALIKHLALKKGRNYKYITDTVGKSGTTPQE